MSRLEKGSYYIHVSYATSHSVVLRCPQNISIPHQKLDTIVHSMLLKSNVYLTISSFNLIVYPL